jgi:hypothetical protein
MCVRLRLEVTVMPQVMLDLSVEEVKALILQLPAQELLTLVDAIEERVETVTMMQLSETGFEEWSEEGEDIYDS